VCGVDGVLCVEWIECCVCVRGIVGEASVLLCQSLKVFCSQHSEEGGLTWPVQPVWAASACLPVGLSLWSEIA